MKGKITTFEIENRRCSCFAPESPAGDLPVCLLCGWEMETVVTALAPELPDLLLGWTDIDGGRDFTPWPVPPVWEGEAFTGGAAAYLAFLTDRFLPRLEAAGGAASPSRRALLGYSLGGLFSLWAMGQGAAFEAFGSLSGSVWYEGFLAYLQSAPLKGTERVYLSLGDREEFGGPPRMRAVGECTRNTYRDLSQRLSDVTLEWNKGGHGKGVRGRWKKALLWAAGRSGEEEV